MVKQKYNPTRIQLLYQMLTGCLQQGQPKEYDIRVDDLKVVQRTSDPEQFFCHEDFILPDTQEITISLYEGASNRNVRYVFLLNEDAAQSKSQATLDGFEKMMEDRLEKQQQQWNTELLKKENLDLRSKLKEAEEYSEILHGEIDELKDRKPDYVKNIGAILSGVVEFIAGNPAMMKNIPGGKALSGLLGANSAAPAPPNQEGEATFKRKGESPSEETDLSSLDAKAVGLDAVLVGQLQQIQEIVPLGEERDRLYRIFQVFAGSPHLIKEVFDLVEDARREQLFDGGSNLKAA